MSRYNARLNFIVSQSVASPRSPSQLYPFTAGTADSGTVVQLILVRSGTLSGLFGSRPHITGLDVQDAAVKAAGGETYALEAEKHLTGDLIKRRSARRACGWCP
jgi:hypothetical protein